MKDLCSIEKAIEHKYHFNPVLLFLSCLLRYITDFTNTTIGPEDYSYLIVSINTVRKCYGEDNIEEASRLVKDESKEEDFAKVKEAFKKLKDWSIEVDSLVKSELGEEALDRFYNDVCKEFFLQFENSKLSKDLEYKDKVMKNLTNLIAFSKQKSLNMSPDARKLVDKIYSELRISKLLQILRKKRIYPISGSISGESDAQVVETTRRFFRDFSAPFSSLGNLFILLIHAVSPKTLQDVTDSRAAAEICEPEKLEDANNGIVAIRTSY